MAAEPPDVAKWGLDPLFWSCVKLANCEVLSIPEHPLQSGCYLLNEHPVVRVEVQGDVVSVHERHKNVTFGVDDGSAVLPCVLWRNEENSDSMLDLLCLGQLVSVRGKITVFREERQVTVSSWHVQTDVHSQCLHWLTVIKLHREEYNRPFQQEELPQTSVLRNAPRKTSTFCDWLQTFLHSNGKWQRFAFPSLVEEAAVHDRAVNVLDIPQPISDEHRDRLRRFLASSIRQLTSKGVVFLSDIVSDTYELISTERHLCPAVVRIVRNTCRHGYKSVSTTNIIEAMRSHSSLCHVPTERLKEAIRSAVSTDQLYEVSADTYRAL